MQALPAFLPIFKDQKNRKLQVILNFLNFLASPVDDNSSFKDDLVFRYDETALGDKGAISTPHPRGVSGGGIWIVNQNYDDSIWTPRCQLIGIFRSFERKSRRVFGVPIHHWLELLKSDLPDLARIVDMLLNANS